MRHCRRFIRLIEMPKEDLIKLKEQKEKEAEKNEYM